MAAAIVPLVASLVPLVLPVIPSIVQSVEAIFGAKSGPEKMTVATNMVQQICNQLSTAGKLQGTVDAKTLQPIIETVVQQMKTAGTLDGTPQPIAPVAAAVVASPPVASTGAWRIEGVLTPPGR